MVQRVLLRGVVGGAKGRHGEEGESPQVQIGPGLEEGRGQQEQAQEQMGHARRRGGQSKSTGASGPAHSNQFGHWNQEHGYFRFWFPTKKTENLNIGCNIVLYYTVIFIAVFVFNLALFIGKNRFFLWWKSQFQSNLQNQPWK